MEDDTVYFGNTDIPGAKDQQKPFQPQQQMPVVNPGRLRKCAFHEIIKCYSQLTGANI